MVEQNVPIGTVYGTQTRRRRKGSPFLAMAAIVAVAFWVVAGFCIAVDPFDIYAWGIHPQLKHTNYPPETTPYLIDVVAKDPTIDTVLVGGSTSVDFTPEMMKAIPGVRNPFNLSYEGNLPLDRQAVTDELLKYSHARRILLAFDYTYALRKMDSREAFPFFLYDADPVDDLQMVGSTAIVAAFSELAHHGVVSNSGGQIIAAEHAHQFREFQTDAAMAGLARDVARYRSEIDRPTAKTCADFSAVAQQLIPFARELSRRGVALDIFVPPYSTVTYYDWQNGLRRGQLGDSIMNDQLLMRRCLVAGMNGLAGVRVFGFDNDAWITDDLANYKDTSHVYNPKIQAYMLQAIGAGTHQLTSANIDAYLDALHKRILGARVYNSHMMMRTFSHD